MTYEIKQDIDAETALELANNIAITLNTEGFSTSMVGYGKERAIKVDGGMVQIIEDESGNLVIKKPNIEWYRMPMGARELIEESYIKDDRPDTSGVGKVREVMTDTDVIAEGDVPFVNTKTIVAKRIDGEEYNYEVKDRRTDEVYGRSRWISLQPSGKPLSFGPVGSELEIGGTAELTLEFVDSVEEEGIHLGSGLRIHIPGGEDE